MLIKIRQVISSGWRDVLSRVFWDGQICWTVVWRWVRPTYRGFFLTQLRRVWLSLFPTLIWWSDGVCHLTNKIYREMLCITRHERMTYITIGGLKLNHIQVSAFSWGHSQYRIVLSWDLLAWISVEDRIFCSFTNFITTPELSGPLYINPDIYHTQITEYLLEKTYHQWALFLSA